MPKRLYEMAPFFTLSGLSETKTEQLLQFYPTSQAPIVNLFHERGARNFFRLFDNLCGAYILKAKHLALKCSKLVRLKVNLLTVLMISRRAKLIEVIFVVTG